MPNIFPSLKVHQGAEGQGGVPHSQLPQPGRVSEVPDRRMLDPDPGPGSDQVCLDQELGQERLERPPGPERGRHQGDPSDLLPDEQVHFRFPGVDRCLRGGDLQGGQSCRIHYHHFSLSIR